MAKLLPILQSKLLAAFLGAVTFLAISSFLAFRAAKSITPHAPVAPKEEDLAAKEAQRQHQPSWSFTPAEIDELVRDLREERNTLAKRREQLAELEIRLKAEREELSLLKQNLSKMQTDFDQSAARTQEEFNQKVAKAQEEFDRNITRVQEEEVTNLKRLAKTYAAMEPAAAAAIMRELADPVIVKIMLFMKETETASLLEMLARPNEVAAKRAALISERLRLAISRKAAEKPKS